MAFLAIRILVGYIIGVILLHTNIIVQAKLKGWQYQTIHVILVFIPMVLCTIGYWSWCLLLSLMIISLLHLTDGVKQDNKEPFWWFLSKQALHLISIAIVPAICGVWSFAALIKVVDLIYNDPRLWVYVLGYTTGVWVGSIIIGNLLVSIKRPDCEEETPVSTLASKIGIVERLIVITLALLNQYTAIGIVFGIKGIARKIYAEQTEFKGEIYFLGTGLSFFIAIITALGINLLLRMIGS